MQELFRHEALPYRGVNGFVPSCAATVRDGVENDERVIVLAPSMWLDDLAAEIVDDQDDVTLLPIDEHGRNPTRIATLLHSFETAGEGRRSLGVVDMSGDGRSFATIEESRFADAVLNVAALRVWPMSVVCLYDTDRLDSTGLLALRCSHPVVRGQDTNVEYDPDLAARTFATDLPLPPPGAALLDVRGPLLGDAREFVRQHAGGHGIAPDRVDDLVLAANEIVTNSLRHAGGHATVATWFDGASVVCEVRDHGFINDPLVGRFAPPPSVSSGRGLWLANHLCDLVSVRSAPGRSVVRMYVDR